MQHRIPPLLISFGLVTGLLIVGVTLFAKPHASSVLAALPENHPDINPVPSTPRDFFLPGTQPEQLQDSLASPTSCASCHAFYSGQTGQAPETETWHTWQGSMMAQAGRDPLFYAALDVANAGAANSGEFCLRCHMPRGWLDGRSSNPDGSEMNALDQEGVQCAFCHRMVDPVPDPENPERDSAILAAITPPVTTIGSGSMIVDVLDFRRGPFDVTADLGFDPHQFAGAKPTQISPYHQESAFCGTCHDINNPVFTWDAVTQSFQPNPLDEPGDPAQGFPIERTYSEWRLSSFNTPEGVYAPQFGGNKSIVSSCQDCHMHDVTGAAGAFGDSFVIRDNMPLHDLTGANTWVPKTILAHPEFGVLFEQEQARADALLSGIERARYMLQNAADLDVYRSGSELFVTVLNHSGHKLPSGYVEGRRMWLQVEGYDAGHNLVFTSGAYDVETAVLQGYGSDQTLKVYESKQGLTADWAETLDLEAGASFHFALNNQIVSDNRIPPRGYNFETYNAAWAAPYSDGQPDATMYADGQFWDTTAYSLPENVAYGVVRLLYQTASKEYIEFLRDNNPNPGYNNGEILFDLWEETGRSEPEVMAEIEFGLETSRLFLPLVERP